MSTQVKGAVLLSRKEFVREEYGDDAWQKVLGGVSAANRAQLEGVLLSSRWYPFEINADLDRAIVEVLGRGDRNVLKKIGARSARTNLGGAHQAFLKKGNPQAFMAGTDRIYRFYYDEGHREYESTGPSSGVITTHGAATFSENDCLTVIGWYEEALRMCGATRVQITEDPCRARGGPYCRYLVSWAG
jgi:uncharacterized protein (TIGR02265 family)